jgi:Coenzyme PQQ synthesis protein D (PqqD)
LCAELLVGKNICVALEGIIMSIALDTKLSRNDDILHAPVGSDEVVMMSVAAGRYYGLNTVASRIWELLETPKTIAQVCAQICDEFEVDAQTCEAEVLKFVQDLVDNEIVHKAAA